MELNINPSITNFEKSPPMPFYSCAPNWIIQQDVENAWSILLNNLNTTKGETDKEIEYIDNTSTFFRYINKYSDFYSEDDHQKEKQNKRVDTFNTELLKGLKADITSFSDKSLSFKNPLWNESLSDLYLTFLKSFDKETIKLFENITRLEFNGDFSELNGSISISDSKVKFRITDILNANAGNSFKENSIWVIPWYNINNASYSTVRGTDKLIEVLVNSQYLALTDTKAAERIKLLMPKYARQVEVEDLNRNFWVIAQTLSAMAAFLLDPDGPINTLLKGVLKELIEMWENVEYLWGQMGAYGTEAETDEFHFEVVTINESEIQPFMKFDNIKDNFSLLDEEIIKRIKYLKKIYSKVDLIVIPEIRYNNYEKNYYSKVVYPGIYASSINDQDFRKKACFKEKSVGNNTNRGVFISSDGAIVVDASNSDWNDRIGFIADKEKYYKIISPLNTDFKDTMDYRYYRLLRPRFSLYKDGNSDITVNFRLYDVGAILTGVGDLVYQFNTNYNFQDNTIRESSGLVQPIVYSKKISIIPIKGNDLKSYYMGELVSFPKDISQFNFAIAEGQQVDLKPVPTTGEDKTKVKDIAIEQIRSEKEPLQAFLIDLSKKEKYKDKVIVRLVNKAISSSYFTLYTGNEKFYSLNPNDINYYPNFSNYSGSKENDIAALFGIYIPSYYKENGELADSITLVNPNFLYETNHAHLWGIGNWYTITALLYTRNGQMTDGDWFIKVVCLSIMGADASYNGQNLFSSDCNYYIDGRQKYKILNDLDKPIEGVTNNILTSMGVMYAYPKNGQCYYSQAYGTRRIPTSSLTKTNGGEIARIQMNNLFEDYIRDSESKGFILWDDNATEDIKQKMGNRTYIDGIPILEEGFKCSVLYNAGLSNPLERAPVYSGLITKQWANKNGYKVI